MTENPNRRTTDKKKIGLVLSGGATHGFAQIGALKVLEEYNIKPDVIVGCSVGSLVGAAMASGKTMDEIEKAVLKENFITFFSPSLGKQGLMNSERIVKFLLKTIKVDKFEDLNTKLIVNATNLTKGGEKVFEDGDLLPALRASISIPGIFAPVVYENDILIDGGFYDITPIHLAKDMDTIIIIDVSKVHDNITTKSSILSIIKQSAVNLQQRVININIKRYSETHNIILIRPSVSKFGLFEYKSSSHREMLRIGEEEARKVLESDDARNALNLYTKPQVK